MNTTLWGKDDKEMLKEWIRENKTTKVPYATGLPGLCDLLPGKTINSIYSMWRDL
jgi:hypothetical protein